MRKKRRSAYLLESLEARLLFSADLAPLPVDGGTTGAEFESDLEISLQPDSAGVQEADENTQERQEVIFVDSGVDDYQQLIDDIESQLEKGRQFDIVNLDSDSDGIDQISAYLRQHEGIDAVHVVSHGSEDAVKLGNVWLTPDKLDAYADAIEGWQQALSSDADLLFYGCNLAAGDGGQDLVNSLTLLTDADVAASDDVTGNDKFGGDWVLEYKSGEIEASVPFSVDLQANWSGVLNTFTVTTTADGVAGSLRQAIIDANALGGTNEITLNPGTYTLSLGELEITNDLTINGADARTTLIDGNGADRVFKIDGNSTATLTGITIMNGNQNNSGGLFVNGGSTLNLSDAIVRDNTSNMGGGIHVHGTANLERVLLYNNTANEGGGIHFHGADGGSLTNVTISGNFASAEGGGLYTDTSITITNSTIADNTATTQGGGMFVAGGTVDIANSIVADNSAGGTGPDVFGTLSSSGSNLFESLAGGSGFHGSDVTAVDPLLGLSDNGGSLMTHAPAAAQAIDGADRALMPTTDQRGFLRGDSTPDMGAHEVGASVVSTADYFDQFNAVAYNGDDGALPWANDWQEFGDGTGAGGGSIQVTSHFGDLALQIESPGDGAWRQADLAGATSATLSFNYARSGMDAGDTIIVEISTDGTNWDELTRFDGPADDAVWQTFSTDISAYIDSDTRIRFTAANGMNQGDDHFFVDNVRINLAGTSPTNNPPTATNLTSTSSYNEGDASVPITDIVVSDADTGETIKAMLTLVDATTGSLSANDGASYDSGTGIWTITDTVANVNLALANLVFNPNVNNDVDTTISVSIDDGDEDASGPLTGTITLDVTPADITSDLIVHLEFSEGSGTTAFDSTAYGNNAYLTGTQDWVGGAIGGGFHFDYSDGEDFFEINNAASVENLQEGSFTLAAWFKADDVPPASDAYGIIVKEGWHTGVWYNSNKQIVFEHTLSGPSYPKVISTNTYDPGSYHHIAVTLDRPSGTITLYVDGVFENSSSFTPGAASWEYNSETWKVGTARDVFPTSVDFPAKGSVDDVRIYSRAITAPESAELFNLGNSAPTVSGTYNLAVTDEDTTSAAVQVNAILSDASITANDLDGDTLGIAVFATTGLGNWQYSTDGATGWTGFGTVDPNAALLLSETTWVRYVPDGANGESVGFDFRAWDQSTDLPSINGTPRFGDATPGGGTTAYSTGNASVALTVSAVNDAPTATNLTSTSSYNEGDATVDITDIVVSDVDSGDTITATLTLNDYTTGSLSTNDGAAYDGLTGVWTITDTVANVNLALANLVFTPLVNNDVDTTITTHIEDAAGAGPADGTITLDVTPANDAPTATNLTSTSSYNEGDATVDITDIVVSDADSGDTITATLTLNDYTTGSLSANDGAAYDGLTGVWTITDTVANVNLALANLVFTPLVNNDVDTTITTHIEDAAGAGPADGTITLDVTPANDAPGINNASFNVDENSTNGTVVGNVPVTDPDAGDTHIYSIIAGNTGGTFAIDNTGNITVANSIALNFETNPVFTLTVQVQDQGGTGLTETATITVNLNDINDAGTVTIDNATPAQGDSLTANVIDPDGVSGAISFQWFSDGVVIGGATGKTYTTTQADVGTGITVTAVYTDDLGTAESLTSAPTTPVTNVNEEPIAMNDNLNATEDQSVTFTSVTDLLGNDSDMDGDTLTISGFSQPANGMLADNGDGTFTYTPAGNFNGNDSFTYTIRDNNGGTAVGTAIVVVAPIGDTPQVTNVSTNAEVQSGLINIDRNANDGAEVTHFKISGITNGILYFADGVTRIDNGDFITIGQGQAGLRFTPAANSTADGSFNVESSEDGVSVASQSGIATSIISILTTAPQPSEPVQSPIQLNTEETVIEETEQEDSEDLEDVADETDVQAVADDMASVEAPQHAKAPGIKKASLVPGISVFKRPDLNSNNDRTPGRSTFLSPQTLKKLVESENLGELKTALGKLNITTLPPDVYELVRGSLDAVQEEMGNEILIGKTVLGSAIATSVGLSAGYVVWMLKGGSLLASVLSSLPAWQLADPLAILVGTKEDEDEDDDTLETIIKDGSGRNEDKESNASELDKHKKESTKR